MSQLRAMFCCLLAASLLLVADNAPAAKAATAPAHAATHDGPRGDLSLANARFQWPTAEKVAQTFALRDYNTRIIVLGAVLLGISAAMVGVFVLLRKRSLVGDVIGHASLPGVAIAFMVMELLFPNSPKSLGALLLGAAVAGLAGVLTMTAISRWTRVKEDAALAIVLGVFFGLGVALLTVVQKIPSGQSAGLNHFIFGSAASLLAADVWLIAAMSVIVLVAAIFLFKELTLLCFDAGFARAQGWPTLLLDLALMTMVVAVAEIGAQSVGLVLVVALMVIPAASGRFWSDDIRTMTAASVLCGLVSAWLGVMISALFTHLPAGALITLVGGMIFLFSMLLGRRRGILWRLLDARRLQARVGRHDLLRAWFECLEPDEPREHASIKLPGAAGLPGYLTEESVAFAELLNMRTWHSSHLRRLIARAQREGLIDAAGPDQWKLTTAGAKAAAKAARNHRLWELYLIHFADVAPSRVDRDADEIEHILEPELIDQLEQLLAQDEQPIAVPPSPHAIERVIAS